MTKIMIIDDDFSSTNLIKTWLELDGFEVSVVLRGQEALSKALKFEPDAFLIDYHLDDRSGIDLVKELRAVTSFATTPIIMASGRDVSEEAVKAGVNRFLIKPYPPDELVQYFMALIG
jgi:DNA-binding response OmpR family regulator